MTPDERPTIPAPPISSRELAREWERRLADAGHLEIKRMRIAELELENEQLRDALRQAAK